MKNIFFVLVFSISILFGQEGGSINLESKKEKKNTGLAILYSLLIPGMGELYAGNYSSGKYFTIADAFIWGTFAGFSVYGNWQENNYRNFAVSNAGVNLSNKRDDYFATIGEYISIDQYNTIQELNRDFDNVLDTETHYWNWENPEDRKTYRNSWSSSEQAYNNVRFAVGALILNRVISAINAVRVSVSENNKISMENPSYFYGFGIDQKTTLPSSITFNFVKLF